MSQQYFAILTTYGAAQIAEATAQNKTIHIEAMAVGDGNGKDTSPDENQTQLVKENYRSNLNSLKSEAGKNTVIAELIIKENIGGWWIREMGLYDDKGGLIAVANCPASYKPQLEEGSGKVQTLRMVFVVSNTAAVTISVSQDIGIASIELVEETMKQHIADDDPHSKDYYNKKITDKTNADLRQDLSDTAQQEANRGRDEAIQHADKTDAAHVQAEDPHPQYTTEGETKGLIQEHVQAPNPHGERYYLKDETNGVVNEVMQAHQNAPDPHPQYTTDEEVRAIATNLHALRVNSQTGTGSFENQMNTSAPIFVDASVAEGNHFSPALKQYSAGDGGYGTQATFGTYRYGGTTFPAAAIALAYDNGHENHWLFGPDGSLASRSFKVLDVTTAIAAAWTDFNGVSSLIRWNAYRDNHVIFDASSGISPSGGGVSVANATEPWREAFPVLMGWNGENTHGVRVDSCRTADKLLDGSFGVPTGVPLPWPSNTPPAGWIFLQGQGINPAEAPILASLYGATLPDLRGMYISGWDAGRGIDPGRSVLSYQAANVGEHQHTVPFDDGGWLPYSGGGGQPGVNYVRTQPRATVDGPTGRTHPDNIAFNYIVRWG
ncbi:phage tail protein [Iodobacter sp. CM08]|uniref:phage tail-collar fiber domain-containing protein n=1 Tax=Iodobacter sp. CM08 TaxID=3085902 RepID=UPI00298111E4|nr:phage tail protein [Iodobacter sp. CM08]MDW5418901.1 phage tail protein [Iodobacter sp. CM08]